MRSESREEGERVLSICIPNPSGGCQWLCLHLNVKAISGAALKELREMEKKKKKKNLVSESLKGVRLMRMLGWENESGVENEMQANLQHLSEISKHDRLGTFAASNKHRSLLLAQVMDRSFFIFPFRFQGVRLSLNIKR